MIFTIHTDCEEEYELCSSSELEWAIARLNAEPGAFLWVASKPRIGEVAYIQAAHIQKTKGLFKKKLVASYYQVEVQEEKPNGDLIQHFFNTEEQAEVLRIFCDFFESGQVPDLSQWEHELFYKAAK